MPITINGTGTVTGISAGGLPDGIVTAPDLSGAQTGSAPIYGCRAWVNFDGTGTIGTNQTIRASGNVTSVLKNGTGDYTITFTTAMPDANYAVHMTETSTPVGGIGFTYLGTLTSSTARVLSFGNYPSGVASASDSSQICVSIFR